MTSPLVSRRALIRFLSLSATSLGLGLPLAGHAADAPKDQTIMNATYDVGRELFSKINPLFVEHWKKQTGATLKIDQSFGGTSRQAQDIIQGKKADTVTFNQVPDIDLLTRRKLVAQDWQKQFPNNSSPYYSTIAFMVRKGNPKNIRNWDDLARPDVKLLFPNPKTSGNARYSYLGAWIFANEKFPGDDKAVQDFMGSFLGNVENFPTGGRGATMAFAQHGQGDVLLTFESEIKNIVGGEEFKTQGFELVVPPVSVLAEFPVAIVDKVVKAKGTREVAKAYLDFQYSREIQQLLAESNLRVHNEEVAAAFADRFAKTRLVDPASLPGGWEGLQKTHFASGGTLDQLLATSKKR
ncbi:MAG: thiosulfate ABC transporter substrate-binding protein CysP [Lautropia sp.]|nr:thiosulfate ABC transporter substrate-binding protein CysP [Lautropia sp.]